ncbi:MAG: hypothetical protein D6726_04590 [Nitrospirae bacterium]|nr:MAG: hypothetical protein D6726_04590 [Nitrospirota bacterium]
MKFVVSRQTSRVGANGKPCEEAREEELTPLDYRMVSTLEEAKKKVWYKDWLEGGTGHREENGMVVCEKKEKVKRWVVEINSLEELISFQAKHGTITLTDSTPYSEAKKEIILNG